MKTSTGPMTIGNVARQAGVGVETVRFYERRGLVQQPLKPTGAGMRYHPDEAIARIRFIREAQELGFSLREIAEFLSLRAAPDADCAAVREQAQAKVDEVERKIARLGQVRTALQTLIAACPGQGGLAACSILDHIDHKAPVTMPEAEPESSRKRRPSMKTLNFTIDGMRCEGCAATVRALLEQETGVKAVQVAHDPGSARVLFDPAAVDEIRLVSAIERPGYRVTATR